jgi:hypothetical protein
MASGHRAIDTALPAHTVGKQYPLPDIPRQRRTVDRRAAGGRPLITSNPPPKQKRRPKAAFSVNHIFLPRLHELVQLILSGRLIGTKHRALERVLGLFSV